MPLPEPVAQPAPVVQEIAQGNTENKRSGDDMKHNQGNVNEVEGRQNSFCNRLIKGTLSMGRGFW